MAQILPGSAIVYPSGPVAIEDVNGSQAKVNAHANRTDNPHATTADQVGAVPLDGHTAMTGLLTLKADPTSALHAATKQYVDGVVQGLQVKAAVRVATTANITLSGTQTIDGVLVAVGERVLVKNQTTQSQNGIYTVQSGAWTRATDFDQDSEVRSGAFCFVQEGSSLADTGWALITDGSITLGTTALTFSQFSGAGQLIMGDGLTKNGNIVSFSGTTNQDFKILGSNKLGIGISGTPAASLQIVGAGSVSLSTHGLILLGDVTSANMAFDGNDIQARNNGAASPIYINGYGGDVVLTAAGSGNVGIGLTSPTSKLHVSGTFNATGNSTIGGTLGVTGATTLAALTASGAATLQSTLSVTGKITASNDIAATGKVTSKNLQFATLTIVAGTTTIKWTHNYGSASYAATAIPNDAARHVSWTSQNANDITFAIDSPYDADIVLLATLIGG